MLKEMESYRPPSPIYGIILGFDTMDKSLGPETLPLCQVGRPWCKIGQDHPRVMIYILKILKPLCYKCQEHVASSSREVFKSFHMGKMAILVT